MSPANQPARLLWLALLLVLVASPARATGVPPTCADDPECQRLLSQGLEFFSASRFSEAQQLFARAYELRADPALLYNLGRTLHKAGKPQEAAPYYQRFLAAGAAGDPEQQRKAEQYLAEAQKEAAPSRQDPIPMTPVPLPIRSDARPSPVPLYRKPWPWVILGVVVAGAAVGLGVGLAARRPDLSDAVAATPFPN
jgi:tetratricopeptide (TPR) repeat protein